MLRLVFYALLIAPTLLLTSCGNTGTGGHVDPAPKPLSDLFVDEANAFEKGMVQTDIIDTLRREGEYTVFLPRSDAFPRVLKEAGLTEEAFLQLDNLKEIFGYHVAIGTFDLADYEAGVMVKTFAGPTLQLQAMDTQHASVNGIRLTSDLASTSNATNGDFQIISTPPQLV